MLNVDKLTFFKVCRKGASTERGIGFAGDQVSRRYGIHWHGLNLHLDELLNIDPQLLYFGNRHYFNSIASRICLHRFGGMKIATTFNYPHHS